jgi:hypothetical protein
MRSVRVALAAGLAIIAIAVAVVLSASPLTVLATNAIPLNGALAIPWRHASACQAGEGVPASTVAIRISVVAIIGTRVRAQVLAGSRVIASGEEGPGWTGDSFTIPVRRFAHAVAPAEICFAVAPSHEGVGALGNDTATAIAARTGRGPLPGRLRIEYLGPGRSSWLALASTVARHMALGRAWSGVWVVFAVATLMLAVAALASGLTLRELARAAGAGARASRRVPTAAWVCALVACLNAASWSFITPPFQAPDEPSHFAYVKQLAETGTLPSSSGDEYSDEEQFALAGLETYQIRKDPARRAIISQRRQDLIDRRLAAFNRSAESKGSAAANVATSEPPLYYALESIPYRLAASGTLLDRLQLMRLLSALIAGATALFSFMFLREALPRVRWAWTVGALAVALTPLFAFMSGAVNPDALLFAISAALFYCLARAFRRGLTRRSAIALGLVIAAGFLTKLNFIGLAPGAFLALGILAVRAARRSGRRALLPPALAAAIACTPVLLIAVRDALSDRSLLGIVSATIETTHGSLSGIANYIWQLYLPRLPGTVDDFYGVSSTRQIWFDGFVGRLGWLDTLFPGWMYSLALIAAAAIAVLCIRSLIANHAALRARADELACYALIALGVIVQIGVSSYRVFPAETAEYGQARYLLPLLPLLAAILVLAARGAGRRWGPVVGTLLVLLFFAQDIFSQLQVIARYYG